MAKTTEPQLVSFTGPGGKRRTTLIPSRGITLATFDRRVQLGEYTDVVRGGDARKATPKKAAAAVQVEG